MTVSSLTSITDAELLAKVKTNLNITGNQFDDQLTNLIDEVKGYLVSAGVSNTAECNVVGSTLAVGVISHGVSNLWKYGNDDTKLSPYFYERADQLRMIRGDDE